ncbi:MAG TPA: Na+/H+ antiporter subunit C [Candidatus Thermoplasmatota archaeon]|nr:Na+/H+ antiporter subunit C [Candidatus Thermoplasmatota archaeon]
METLLAIVIGGLYAAGTYLMLRRSLLRLAIGIGFLSSGANLLIFTAPGLRRGGPPLVPEGSYELAAGAADPLPQALILTAIVITFGVQAFTLVLVGRTYETLGTDDVDTLGEPGGRIER